MNITQARRFIVATIIVVTMSAAVAPGQIASGQASRAETDAADGAVVKLIHELFSEVMESQKDVAAEQLVADGAIIHTQRGDFTGPDGLLAYVDSIHRLYPDASFEVTAIDINGDTIVVQWTMTATRFHLDQTHGPSIMRESSPGETTITVTDGQVAELNHVQQTTAQTSSDDVAVSYGPLE